MYGKLLDYAISVEQHDIFVSYAAHVESIEIRICLNGWVAGRDFDYSRVYYIDDPSCPTVEEMIKHIKEFLHEDN